MTYQNRNILWMIISLLMMQTSVYATRSINLRQHPFSPVNTQTMSSQGISMNETRREVDAYGVSHTRMQEMFRGHEVIGADFVIHDDQLTTTMNGIMYVEMEKDLQATPSFSSKQSQTALQYAIALYQQQSKDLFVIKDQHIKLVIAIDDNNHAQWAYQVNLLTDNAAPVFILQADNFNVLEQWNDFRSMSSVVAGGSGGNVKTGERFYDNLPQHLAGFTLNRNEDANICYMANDHFAILKFGTGTILQFPCYATDENHNQVYWNGMFDMTKYTAYSPANDIFFAANAVQKMYQDWYDVPIIMDGSGNQKSINLFIHKADYDNAYYDPLSQTAVFGDGHLEYYPLASLDITAHELSHGFTAQHSRLVSVGESGALDESFSDMAAKTAQAYAENKNDWQIAADVIKAPNSALRYLDIPSRDCNGRMPGVNCSLNEKPFDYNKRIDPHFGSGVYNRFFYTLVNTPGWNEKKAFSIVLKANRYYWNTHTKMNDAACSVISAAQQAGYNVDDVKHAFNVVKVLYGMYC